MILITFTLWWFLVLLGHEISVDISSPLIQENSLITYFGYFFGSIGCVSVCFHQHNLLWIYVWRRVPQRFQEFLYSYPLELLQNFGFCFAKDEDLYLGDTPANCHAGVQGLRMPRACGCHQDQSPVVWVKAFEQGCPGFSKSPAGRNTLLSKRIAPQFNDACILASGIQCTVFCLRAKDLEREWEQQMWFSLSQWHWRGLINTQWTGSNLMGVTVGAGQLWGPEWGSEPGLGHLGDKFSA